MLKMSNGLYELASKVQEISGKVVSIGKIVLIKIIEFIKAHPNLFIGAVLGAAVGILVNAIPFIGPLLAPLVTVISVSFGAVVGHRMDKGRTGGDVGPVELTENIIEIARDFFQFLIDMFSTVYHAEFVV